MLELVSGRSWNGFSIRLMEKAYVCCFHTHRVYYLSSVYAWYEIKGRGKKKCNQS